MKSVGETQRIAANLYERLLSILKAWEIDVDWRRLSRAVGLDLKAIKAGATPMELQQYYDLLATMADEVGESDFYLSLGNSYDITDLGVLGYALISAENLRRSWELTFHASSLLLHPLDSLRRVESGRVRVQLIAPAGACLSWRWAQEEWLAGTWKWVCQRLPEIARSKDLEINLAYPEPEYSDQYRELFPGSVRFEQPNTEMSFPEHWYDLPFPAANPTTASACQQQCLLIMQQLERQSDLGQAVRRKLLLNPRRQFPDLETMAQEFRMPSYTFHRRLSEVGENYQRIVAEVRMELAKDYLAHTSMHLQEISYLLGYEHPPSFYRAFKKWVGITPQRYRTKGGDQ